VLSAFAAYLAPDAVATVLVVPASAGEFWMIGYLLIRGVRTPPSRDVHPGFVGSPG